MMIKDRNGLRYNPPKAKFYLETLSKPLGYFLFNVKHSFNFFFYVVFPLIHYFT